VEKPPPAALPGLEALSLAALLALYRKGGCSRDRGSFSGLICVVRTRNPGEAGRNLSGARGFRKIFVSLQMDRHSELALCRQNASDPAAAAHPHFLRQGDFGRHHKSQLDRVAFYDLKIGVEESSAPAQVLGKTATLTLGAGQANANRELEVEALRRAALKMNLIGAHDFSHTRRSNIRVLCRSDTEGNCLRASQEIPESTSAQPLY
jgi:hypothetical protein